MDPIGHSGGTALVLWPLLKKPDVLLSADIRERQSPEYDAICSLISTQCNDDVPTD